MADVYVDTIGLVVALDTGADLDSAADYWIYAKKPTAGVELRYPNIGNATIDPASSSKMLYTFGLGELNEVGRWIFQSYVRFASGWEGRGASVSLMVRDNFK